MDSSAENGAYITLKPEKISGFRLSIKHHLLRQPHERQAQSLAVVRFPCIWHFLDSLLMDFFDKQKPEEISGFRPSKNP